MPPQDKYTDPELRDEVKEEMKQSDKGGKPGQWSARKAQMMASEYKKRGGDYTTSKENGQDESQKNLEQWGNEEWQTKEGSGTAKMSDGTEKRYLPKKAWEKMSDGEKEATDKKKQAGSKKGKQYVSNTGKAKGGRKKASEETKEEKDRGEEDEQDSEGASEAEYQSGDEPEDGNEDEESKENEKDEKEAGKKRSASQTKESNKKPKTRQDSRAERDAAEGNKEADQ